MLKQRKGLLTILVMFGFLILVASGLTMAGSGAGTATPLPEPEITFLEGSGLDQAGSEPLPLLGQGVPPCKKVLFLDDRGGSEFSVLKGTLADLGFEVQQVLPTEITASLIAPYDVVVFSLGWYAGGGGQRQLSQAEAATLVEFVNSGKSLFLVGELGRAKWSGNWRKSLNLIARNFGISFGNNLLCSSASHLNNPADPDGGVDLPIVNDLRPRLLGEGVEQFSLFWGASVGVRAPARAAARADATSWRDTDCTWNFMINEWECSQDTDQPSNAWPVLALAESGDGRILAIGDSSWLMNGWINYTDNLQLAKNLFAWLARTPSVRSLTANPSQGVAPLQVRFTCRTNDPGTRVKEVRWDFGDGTQETSPTDNTTIQINHRYTAGGTYAAICTVVDTNDCSSATSSPVTISVSDNRPPVIDAFTADNQTGIEPLRVNFTCRAHDPDPRGSIVNYRFTFGDGNTTSSPNGQAANVYDAGSFNATCTAVDNRGAETVSSPLAVTVLPNQHPVIDSFTYRPNSGSPPLAVNFFCSAHDPDGTISYYRIDFGDGNETTSTSGDAFKTYHVPGTYSVTCTAVDNRGAETTSSAYDIPIYTGVRVTDYTATELEAVCDNITSTRPYSFTCVASSPDTVIVQYEFEFGDNQTAVVVSSDPSVTVQHSYELEEENIHDTRCAVLDDRNIRAYSPFVVPVQVHSCD